MKRLLICVCAIVMICISFDVGLTCNADSFSPYDLSNFGVSSLRAVPLENARQSLRLSLEKGLRVLSSSAAYEAESYPREGKEALVYQDLSLTYSEEVFLVETVYSPVATELFCPVYHPKYGSVYVIALELSLVPGNRTCERISSLTNTYFFSVADLSCIAVEGIRTGYGNNGPVFVSKFSQNENDDAFVSTKGERWDSAAYCSKTSLRREGEGNSAQFCFSFCISMEDLATTLSAEDVAYVRRALSGAESFLCGGFDLRPVIGDHYTFSDGVRDMLCLSASLPCFTPTPLSSEGESWNQFLAKKEFSDPSVFTHLLAPLYLAGNEPKAPLEEESETETPETCEKELNQSLDPIPSQTQSTKAEYTEESPVQVTQEDPSFEEQAPFVSSEYFPFWENLPDAEDFPEETERFYDEEEKEGTELLSTILFFGSGALLFFSVMVAVILFRVDEKKGKKTKKS